jgi:hypothetical protein
MIVDKYGNYENLCGNCVGGVELALFTLKIVVKVDV